ncbi:MULTISPECIES: aldo/keto reductase [Brucella/Ochrobactrum group]|uniref:Aldo/keto reductase n=2 Tax=Ochrobactrum TaxID=528 RepID=A0A2P9HQE9_9HYPH|nr:MULTISPECIES: aldo/keto reductase [Brucella]MCI0999937.1 aldo/keto reductase [Ochrobactrum sp. C6C9]RRD24252.1 aldo/keto reductase [Brucellaceae bacterium VT-16-1752]WHT41785.1 aldo/keto reductase [Ochrobactrum sp. SSR]MDX4073555.1 aldo/keto reductase [Brucella sp. NBRC 113783]NNU62132.1 aldo/keto reductase [[Ochrobactrum] soli]
MEYKKLGRTELKVSPLCFGGNVFGWTVDEATSFSLLDRFVDAGLNFIDTADVYSAWANGNVGGESETIIGNWLKSRGLRDRVVIATKVGSEMGPDEKGLSPAYIRKAVDASLKRLQTDYIDLYQSHWDDPETPFEDTLGTYKELIDAGKVRAIGASNLTPERLTEALDVAKQHNLPRYETLQPLYNLYDRSGFEDGLEAICRDNEIGVIPYYALAAGFLTGKYRSADDLGQSARGKSVEKYLTDRGSRIIAALDQVARSVDATQAQVAIAWLVAHPSITAPIASATRLTQLGELISAAELKLSKNDLALLNKASA